MRATITRGLARLRRDQHGLTTVEYAIVLCLIAAVVVGTWQEFGSRMKARLSEASDTVNDSMQSGSTASDADSKK